MIFNFHFSFLSQEEGTRLEVQLEVHQVEPTLMTIQEGQVEQEVQPAVSSYKGNV